VLRLGSYVYVAIAVIFVVVKWKSFGDDFALIQAGSADGYIGLAWPLMLLVGMVVVVYKLRQEKRSRHAPAPSSLKGPESLEQLQSIIRQAFAKRPVSMALSLILATVVMISIPVILVSLAQARAPGEFGRGDWFLVGCMELPLLCVITIFMISFARNRTSATNSR